MFVFILSSIYKGREREKKAKGWLCACTVAIGKHMSTFIWTICIFGLENYVCMLKEIYIRSLFFRPFAFTLFIYTSNLLVCTLFFLLIMYSLLQERAGEDPDLNKVQLQLATFLLGSVPLFFNSYCTLRLYI